MTRFEVFTEGNNWVVVSWVITQGVMDGYLHFEQRVASIYSWRMSSSMKTDTAGFVDGC